MSLLARWGLTCLLYGLGWSGSVQAQTVVKYIHTDALGSVVIVTDANRNVLKRHEYEPYGAQLAPAMQGGAGYTGHLQDAATGLVYMQQRYYDPLCGCFLSVDPITAYDNPIDHFHRYRYANNNPYRFTDPDGRAADTFVDAAFILYDGGRFLGAAAAWGQGKLTGNEALAATGREGMAESGRDLGASALSAAVPGVVAPVARSAVKGGEAVVDANRAASRAKGVSDNMIGPSGRPKQHTVDHNTRKGAREAAQRDAPQGGRVRHDANPANPNQRQHFQAENAKGENVKPVRHHEYPDRYK